MGVGGVANAGGAEVAEVLLVQLDDLVAVGQVQHDRVLTMDRAVAQPIDADAGRPEGLPLSDVVIVAGLVALDP